MHVNAHNQDEISLPYADIKINGLFWECTSGGDTLKACWILDVSSGPMAWWHSKNVSVDVMASCLAPRKGLKKPKCPAVKTFYRISIKHHIPTGAWKYYAFF